MFPLTSWSPIVQTIGLLALSNFFMTNAFALTR